EQRQAEAALALERPVAGTGVAAHAAEQPHDVAFEVHGLFFGLVRGRGRHRRRGDQDRDPRDSHPGGESGQAGNKHVSILQRLVLPPAGELKEAIGKAVGASVGGQTAGESGTAAPNQSSYRVCSTLSCERIASSQPTQRYFCKSGAPVRHPFRFFLDTGPSHVTVEGGVLYTNQ